MIICKRPDPLDDFLQEACDLYILTKMRKLRPNQLFFDEIKDKGSRIKDQMVIENALDLEEKVPCKF